MAKGIRDIDVSDRPVLLSGMSLEETGVLLWLVLRHEPQQ